jgi:hypothetical protein
VADSLKWLKDALHTVAPGLNNVVSEVGAEMKRLGVQGQMELASALFSGNAFVPYGPGQYTPTPEQGPGPEAPSTENQPDAAQHQHERGGMER